MAVVGGADLARNRPTPRAYRTGHRERDNPLLERFDLIIGSDVLYERDQPEQLASFIARHAAPIAGVLIIDPDRGNRNAFKRHMAGHGFDCAETRLVTPPPDDGTPYRGRTLHFQRALAAPA